MTPLKPLIFGCSGTELSREEREFFAHALPCGLIVFQRNCANKKQLSQLIEDFKSVTDNEDALILIDQEGGRVARLRKPEWPEYPPASFFLQIAGEDIAKAKDAVFENYRDMGAILSRIGINTNCAPVCDLLFDDAHGIIGDRAFGHDPATAASLAASACDGLLAAGVQPVIKHIPGHGRAKADSHIELPVVYASYEELNKTDFEVFRRLKNAQYAMTAHILYHALDADNPATLSKAIIKDCIRGDIGFTGTLMSDDISMKALQGNPGDLALRALIAGCDLVLHCNADMAEMLEITSKVSDYTNNLKAA